MLVVTAAAAAALQLCCTKPHPLKKGEVLQNMHEHVVREDYWSLHGWHVGW